MAFLVGAASLLSGTLGGAVGAIASKRNKKPADKVEEELISKAKELEKKIKTLEGSMKDEAVDKEQLNVQLRNLGQEKEALIKEQQEHEAQKAELEVHNRILLMQHMLLIKSNAALQERAEQLAKEKNDLMKQLQLEQQMHQDELRQRSVAMEDLKESVTGVVRRLLASELSEEAAAKELEGLGCQVQFVDERAALPAGPGEASDVRALMADAESGKPEQVWNVQDTQMLLEDKGRLERFVSSCMRMKSSGGGAVGSEGGASASGAPVLRLPSVPRGFGATLDSFRAVDAAVQSTFKRLTEGGGGQADTEARERDQGSKGAVAPEWREVRAAETKKQASGKPNLNGRKVVFTIPGATPKKEKPVMGAAKGKIDSSSLASMMSSATGSRDDDFPMGLGTSLTLRR